jgi:signal peptidase II
VRRSFPLLLGVAGAVLVLDQWTKHWATRVLQHRDPVRVIGDFVRLTFTRNSGVAFGIGAGLPFPYYVFSFAAVAAIFYLFLRHPLLSLARQLALALILGGAVGNLVDRLRSGQVVDFVEVGVGRFHWPVFNAADSAVTVGVLLLALTWSRRHEARDARPGGMADDPHAGVPGPGAERGGAAGPLPGGGPDRPVP